MTPNGKAVTTRTTFGRTTEVGIEIKAHPSIVWKLLTDAPDFPRWNTTVISIDGAIAPGGHLKLISTLAPKRIFKLKIKEFVPDKLLVWGDMYGVRVYKISGSSGNSVSFSMSEKIGGFMFPLYAKHIPSFDQSFEQFAADLKKEAELIQNLKN